MLSSNVLSQVFIVKFYIIVDIFMIIIINLLLTVTYMLSVTLPATFCALQVYLPSSWSVTFAKIKVVFFLLGRMTLFLYQDSCGSGKPSITLQVRLTLSPSWMSLPGLTKTTFGRTKTIKQNEQENRIKR